MLNLCGSERASIPSETDFAWQRFREMASSMTLRQLLPLRCFEKL